MVTPSWFLWWEVFLPGGRKNSQVGIFLPAGRKNFQVGTFSSSLEEKVPGWIFFFQIGRRSSRWGMLPFDFPPTFPLPSPGPIALSHWDKDLLGLAHSPHNREVGCSIPANTIGWCQKVHPVANCYTRSNQFPLRWGHRPSPYNGGRRR